MSGLSRHEFAQRRSRDEEESKGFRTLSFSTTEVADYLIIRPGSLCVLCRPILTLVEIKTGEGRLSKRQAEVLPQLNLQMDVREEHWWVTDPKVRGVRPTARRVG